jgi:hypothetical protein
MMRILLLLVLIFVHSICLAAPLDGTKKIYLVSETNELTHVANVEFKQNKDNIAYTVSIVDTPFENQFLSMRPFQCVMGSRQVMCHVPYPYEKKGFVTEDDLMDLSYDILFLHKNPSEYGINMWNGIFYKLELNDEQIDGVVFEVDMNTLASPPDNLDVPFAEDEIFEADVSNYVYPRVLIK